MAHAELKEYAEAIQRRQENNRLADVAEHLVENKLLINQIDKLLNKNPTEFTSVNSYLYRRTKTSKTAQ
jgi:hypothetical protein